MRRADAFLGPMRVPFLLLPPVCVALGVGCAMWSQGPVNPLHVLVVLVGALASHISVNTLNEYFDWRSGLDFHTQRTPFSGGSGTLPARPELARSALATGLVALAITALVGVYFVTVWGWGLLPLGLLGLVIIVFYTPWITRVPLLCLLAPGIGFGVLMVMGTEFAVSGHYSWSGFVASLVPTFLVSDLLLLNQFPDAEADRTVGRRHLLITAGSRTGSLVYSAFLLLAYVVIATGVLLGLLPAASLLGLLMLVIAVPTAVGAVRNAERIDSLVPLMARNVLLNIFTPLLVAIGLFLSI